MESNSFNSSKFYDSLSDKLDILKDTRNEIFNTSIDTIDNYKYNHYFCTKCHKFPFIKFCKDKKNIRMTCSCFNNKKILIKELFEIIPIKNNLSFFLSETNLNLNDDENVLLCKEHNKKFKGFSKFFLNNYCEDCNHYKNKIYDNDIIRFDEIKIEDMKIEELFNKINDNNDLEEIYNNNILISRINDSIDIKLSEKEEIRFKQLINIIINDYKNYPNFSHFFNIKNLLYFFNINEEQNEKEDNIIDDNLFENNKPIIIEYIKIFLWKIIL